MRFEDIEQAKEKFGKLLEQESARIEKMKIDTGFPKYSQLEKIIIGILPGDGIGPLIMEQALRVVDALIGKDIQSGRVELRHIKGLSIEERTARKETIAPEILDELKKCHVFLKGPMTTPRPGDPWPYLPSAVAKLRRELDLFANVRPVRNPVKNADWVLFRENIEGAYVWGSKGIQVDSDLAVDFVVETSGESKRLAHAAFEYARANGLTHVSAITKVNIVKLTDGNLLKACQEEAKKYPEIVYDERLVDITAAKIGDPEFSENLQVLVLPNLYGDIVSDVAAEYAGGVSSAGSANFGTHYALFEAIHGTAPFLINNNRGQYANPSSILRATAMMLGHIGYIKEGKKLDEALDICGFSERKLVITSLPEDASTVEYTDYVLETLINIIL